MARITSLPLATSLHVFPWQSLRLSSMFSCSSNKVTISSRPNDAARCSGVVPDPAGGYHWGRWRGAREVEIPFELSRAIQYCSCMILDLLPDPQRTARCSAAAPVSISPSTDFLLSFPISARNGWMTVGSPCIYGVCQITPCLELGTHHSEELTRA